MDMCTYMAWNLESYGAGMGIEASKQKPTCLHKYNTKEGGTVHDIRYMESDST